METVSFPVERLSYRHYVSRCHIFFMMNLKLMKTSEFLKDSWDLCSESSKEKKGRENAGSKLKKITTKKKEFRYIF